MSSSEFSYYNPLIFQISANYLKQSPKYWSSKSFKGAGSRCQTGEILAHLNNVKCTFSRECHMFHNTRWFPAVNNLKT